MERNIVFYRTSNGKCPVLEFLDSLPAKHAQKVTWVLGLVEELDDIPANLFKKLAGTKGIWECRVKYGSNIYRVLCFFHGNSKVVLTHGFTKKTQKTPKGEIEKAEAMKSDYISRSKP